MKITDADRLDWMELHLQHPAPIVNETDDKTMQCNAWALVGPPGLTLREIIDAMMRRPALPDNSVDGEHDSSGTC